ncbi:MAG TPA: LPS export ABC transporter permease LptG, partial [Chromatiales bacterium]|nr:LPS export ABC transporter permease LptG [Chromatiales bacterium]HEX21870.1 LPS export ABC transporter permease LptG [Chromatiales bacterium]
MRIFQWYIGRTMLTHTFMALGVLLGLFVFLTFIDQLKDIGVGDYGVLDVTRFVVLSIPQQVYDLFPMSVLLGTMLALSALASQSELVAMRAAGVSLLQIVGAVLRVGAIFVVLVLLIGEFVTPTSETQANRGRIEALQQTATQKSDYGLWIRDQSAFISVGEILPDLSLRDIRVFEFDRYQRMRSAVYAETGRYRLEDGTWLLRNVYQSLFPPERVEAKRLEVAQWSLAMDPDLLSAFLIRPEQMSARRLHEYIAHLRENDQETDRYQLAFWHKVMLPFSVAVMVVLAVPFVFRDVRSGRTGQAVF